MKYSITIQIHIEEEEKPQPKMSRFFKLWNKKFQEFISEENEQ